jgi:XTP/dITP diphosphohydrolase
MPRLLLASRNPHKTREFAQILGDRFQVSDLTAHPEVPEAIESGSTFQENARIKALGASRFIAGIVAADDSGLEVDALNGAPGIFSARYAGTHATDAENVAKLLAELARVGAGAGQRAARFRCTIALAQDGDTLEIFEAATEGIIAIAPRGLGGFGYDPVFVPEGFAETFGELPPEVKHSLSHRGRAVRLLRAKLE